MSTSTDQAGRDLNPDCLGVVLRYRALVSIESVARGHPNPLVEHKRAGVVGGHAELVSTRS